MNDTPGSEGVSITTSGNQQVQLQDTPASVTIQTAEQNQVTISDAPPGISISAPTGMLTVTCVMANVTASSALNVSAPDHNLRRSRPGASSDRHGGGGVGVHAGSGQHLWTVRGTRWRFWFRHLSSSTRSSPRALGQRNRSRLSCGPVTFADGTRLTALSAIKSTFLVYRQLFGGGQEVWDDQVRNWSPLVRRSHRKVCSGMTKIKHGDPFSWPSETKTTPATTLLRRTRSPASRCIRRSVSSAGEIPRKHSKTAKAPPALQSRFSRLVRTTMQGWRWIRTIPQAQLRFTSF